jgi:hypothetical protein
MKFHVISSSALDRQDGFATRPDLDMRAVDPRILYGHSLRNDEENNSSLGIRRRY